jgi:hypothetical protein
MKRPPAERKFARLCAEAPDLADLVQKKRLTLTEAWAAFEYRVGHANSLKPKPANLLADLPSHLHEKPEWERRHIEFVKRRDAFNALRMAEQVEIARFVLAHDPESARQVRDGITPLFEAFHELNEAAALLEQIESVSNKTGAHGMDALLLVLIVGVMVQALGVDLAAIFGWIAGSLRGDEPMQVDQHDIDVLKALKFEVADDMARADGTMSIFIMRATDKTLVLKSCCRPASRSMPSRRARCCSMPTSCAAAATAGSRSSTPRRPRSDAQNYVCPHQRGGEAMRSADHVRRLSATK